MAETEIDVQSWHRRETFTLFRSYHNPHHSLTSRIDMSRLIESAKQRDVSTYRACIFAIGAGVYAVPELMARFRGDTVVQHDAVELSMTVPLDKGGFGYAYVPYNEDFSLFDETCEATIRAVAAGKQLKANTGQRDDVIYLSCLPWLDFSALSNALPGPEDCIPRVSWGKYVSHGNKWDMALGIEVHHALVDGEHLGAFFNAVQNALDQI